MTPGRWQEIDRIFQGALDRAPSERQAFLDQACAEDAELRQQVASLLQAHAPDDGFLETPALEQSARAIARESEPMRSGQRLGAYELIAPLGAGGMGEVWRALDPALQREVAIKVVRSQYAGDTQRLRRFQQEAQAAGRLNHANILAVYGAGEERGLPYLVAELLEGATLRQRLAVGPIPETKALEYAMQIAEGLSAAHSKGIVHRDLKPENIFITNDGRVKILDFGLAKLAPTRPETHGDTLTESGTVLGSPGYMSPEQVRAEPVDHRSDIFSLGTVLYEMLTGRRAFSGATSVETMNAILTMDTPAIPFVSPMVDQVVRHCLEKAPGERFQSARDLAFQLHVALHPSAQIMAGKRSARHRPYVAVALIGGLALVSAIAVLTKRLTNSTHPQPAARLTRVTSDSGLSTDPALSSDGKLIAYASDRGGGNLDIWRQQLATGEAIRLTSGPADESEPEFSPDGSRIAFRSEAGGGGIYVVSAFGGGEPRLIAKQGRRPRFSPDGAYVAYWVGDWYIGRAFVVPSDGGSPPKPVQPEFASVMYPVWSSDGQHLLFLGARNLSDLTTQEGFDWWVAPSDGGSVLRTEAAAVLRRQGLREGRTFLFAPAGWLDGTVVFSATSGDSTSLWRLTIEPRTGRVSGPAQRLTFGTSLETKPSAIAGGEIAFASLTQNLNIWSIGIDANRGRVKGEPQKLTHGAFDAHTSVSADGAKLTFISSRSGNPDVWLKDLSTGKEAPLTATPASEEQPEITPDGKRVCYMVNDGQRSAIYEISIDGGTPEKICDNCIRPWDWSPDGTKLLYLVPEGRPGRPRANTALGLLDVAVRQKSEYLEHSKYNLARPRFSPDGRWISFTSSSFESPGTSRIMVAPFEVPGASEEKWIAITDNATFHDKARWSPDGNLLYFVSDRDGYRCVYARRLDPEMKRPAGGAFDVYHSHGARRSLLGKGFQFLEISLTADRLFFNLGEVTGNIWITKLEQQK